MGDYHRDLDEVHCPRKLELREATSGSPVHELSETPFSRVGEENSQVTNARQRRDAGRAAHAVATDEVDEILNAAHRFPDVQAMPVQGGEAGRVVPAVFQSMKPIKQDGRSRSSADIANDAAHF